MDQLQVWEMFKKSGGIGDNQNLFNREFARLLEAHDMGSATEIAERCLELLPENSSFKMPDVKGLGKLGSFGRIPNMHDLDFLSKQSDNKKRAGGAGGDPINSLIEGLLQLGQTEKADQLSSHYVLLLDDDAD